jgi:HipA-like protein
MTTELVTFLGDSHVGRLARDRHGRLSFSYEEAWRRAPDGYPISLSMPLALVEHGHRSRPEAHSRSWLMSARTAPERSAS